MTGCGAIEIMVILIFFFSSFELPHMYLDLQIYYDYRTLLQIDMLTCDNDILERPKRISRTRCQTCLPVNSLKRTFITGGDRERESKQHHSSSYKVGYNMAEEGDALSDSAVQHRAKYASLNRSRPTDFMGGSQVSFREKPPAPIKIDTSTSFQNNPFLKDRKMKSAIPK
jgi:hypothetical protein